MFLNFFTDLRAAKVPVSLREYLTLLEALIRIWPTRGSRISTIFARLPGEGRTPFRPLRPGLRHAFQGIESLGRGLERRKFPEDWLTSLAERYLSDEEKREIAGARLGQALGDAEAAARRAEGASSGRQQMDRHRRHLALRRLWLQPRRHPHRPGQEPQFPRGEGVGKARVQGSRRQRRARHAQHASLALRRLRRFARTGAAEELDLDGDDPRRPRTRAISTSSCGPERRNAVKVLLFLDVGGSMDWHVEIAEELFSAARPEFKHFEHFYFHNCLYEKRVEGQPPPRSTRRSRRSM